MAAASQKGGLQVALNPKGRMRVAESLEVSDVLLQLTIQMHWFSPAEYLILLQLLADS